MQIKVLLVDDHELIRRLVCSMLEERTEFQVIGQAADGLEAVKKAEELHPDLILLDIRLPKLSGSEALPLIRKVTPKSKILMLTGIDSPELVEDVLSKGASGYVIKSEAGRELFEAIEAVMQGNQFVSRVLRKTAGKVLKNFQANR